MAGELLNAEYARVMAGVSKLVEETQGGITLELDGWSDNTNKSVAACNITLPSRKTLLLKVFDATDEAHTGEYLAGARLSLCMHGRGVGVLSAGDDRSTLFGRG